MSDIDEHDEQVRIAVKALGDMRNINNCKYSSTPSSENADPAPPHPQFVSRVTHIPLVSTALRAYEQSKNSSRVVKYGADLVESSVKTISRPVIDRLPVESLDEFACRQLDRLESYRTNDGDKSMPKSNAEDDSGTDATCPSLRRRIAKANESSDSSGANKSPSSTSSPSSPLSNDGPPLSSVRPRVHSISQLCEIDPQLFTPLSSQQNRRNAKEGKDAPLSDHQSVVQQSRSRWQAVLLEAGGFSAALSEESMRRLKYCLHWLQYATAHIDAQILILRDFVAALQPLPPNGQPPPSTAPISPAHLRTLTEVRRDVVRTIRQVVDVVSKYAGSALPEPARVRVRGFILKLPQRWASANAAGEGAGAASSTSLAASAAGTGGRGLGKRTKGSRSTARSERGTGSSRTASPISSRASSPRRHQRREPSASTSIANSQTATSVVAPTAGAAVQAAQKILALSTESLDMMRGVTAVVKDSLDRAEAWVGRLRAVGLQRDAVERRASEADVDVSTREDRSFAGLPPFHFGFGSGSASSAAFERGARRRSSAYTDFSSAPSTPGGPAYYDPPVIHTAGNRGVHALSSSSSSSFEYPSWSASFASSSLGTPVGDSGPGTPLFVGQDLDVGVGELSLGRKSMCRRVKEVIKDEASQGMEVDEG